MYPVILDRKGLIPKRLHTSCFECGTRTECRFSVTCVWEYVGVVALYACLPCWNNQE